jgi:hypothetical protein
MDVYLSLEKYDSFNHGEFTTVLGVATSPEKAKELWKTSSRYKGNDTENLGEDNVWFTVEIATLDKPLV